MAKRKYAPGSLLFNQALSHNSLRRSLRLASHFERLADDVVLKILHFVSDDAKSLTRCLAVSQRFNSLASESKTVNYRLRSSRTVRGLEFRPNISLDDAMNVFPNVKHVSLQLHRPLDRRLPAPITRWKVITSSSGPMHVRISIGSLCPLHPRSTFLTSPSSFRVVEDPRKKRLKMMLSLTMTAMMLDMRDKLPDTIQSIALRMVGEGQVVIEDDEAEENDDGENLLSGYYLFPCEARSWTVEKMQLPRIGRFARHVNVAIAKRSSEPIVLEEDVLVMADAFEGKDYEEGDLGRVLSEIAKEISKKVKTN